MNKLTLLKDYMSQPPFNLITITGIETKIIDDNLFYIVDYVNNTHDIKQAKISYYELLEYLWAEMIKLHGNVYDR